MSYLEISDKNQWGVSLSGKALKIAAARCGLAALVVAVAGYTASAESGRPDETGGLQAEVTAPRLLIQTGQPIWLEFLLRNQSDEPLTLTVADLPVAQEPPASMGLPLEHVFSGEAGESIDVRVEADAKSLRVSSPSRPPAGRPVVVAPHGVVGTQIDLTRYCDAVRRPGTYEIQWRPYRGALQSKKIRLVVAPLRQAVIHTDFGRMTVRFYYDQAPRHIENFLELAERGFYDGLTFHRVIHGGLIQGGCPRGDGTGVRADGKLLKAEISDLPIDVGSVVMATVRNAPDSGSSQFYIALTRLRNLDGKQTVFGHLVGEESFATLRKLGSVPTGDQDRPLKQVYIRNISLENVSPDEEGRFGGTRRGNGSATRPTPGRAAPVPLMGPASDMDRLPAATSRPTPGPVRGGSELRTSGGAAR